MDFTFSEEQKMIIDSVKKFAESELRPQEESIEESEELPVGIFKKLAALGLLGINIPFNYGGVELDLLTAVLIVEQMAYGSPSVTLSYGVHDSLCAFNIFRNGNESQRKKYLPELCSGRKVGALAITEPGAGSDAVSITTSARKKDDRYLLNGRKCFITNAPIANVVVVYAKTKKDLGARGISAFIVERSFPGFSTPGKLDKLGHKGSPTGDIVFEDCEVPEENLLGGENQGVHVMMSGLDIERAFFAGAAVGMAQKAMDLAVKYAKERSQFGRPIAAFQLIQAKLADMYTQIEASRLLCYKAAKMAERAKRGGKGTEIHRLAAASLLMAAETCQRVCDQSLQIHGGYGYCSEYPISRLYRDARLMTIGAGTSEIRRLIIAREILGM